jgi:hypothetical protein
MQMNRLNTSEERHQPGSLTRPLSRPLKNIRDSHPHQHIRLLLVVILVITIKMAQHGLVMGRFVGKDFHATVNAKLGVKATDRAFIGDRPRFFCVINCRP